MNQIHAQQSEKSRTEKTLRWNEAVRQLTAENNRLKLYLIQMQSEQEQEFLAAKKSAMLMQRYISIMDLSLQYSTRHLLLARGEVPTEEKVDLAALQLTRSVSTIVEKMEMQQLQEQRLQQQVQQVQQHQQLSTQRSMQQNAKTQSLQQPNKIHGQPQMNSQHNNIMQKLQLGSPLSLHPGQQATAQMFPTKAQSVAPTSSRKLTPLMQMQKQLHAHRMKSALSDLPSRINSLGGAFGTMASNLPPQLSGFGAGSIGGRSPAIGSLAGGMAAGLPMSSQMMNNMKYMRGITGGRSRVNDSTSSLLGGIGVGTTQTGLSNIRPVGTGMGKSPAENMTNAMAGFPGMNGANFGSLNDLLGTPNTVQMPVDQNVLQQTLLKHVRQKIQNQQQHQKNRQQKFQTSIRTLSGLNTPPLKRVKLESKMPIITPGDLLTKNGVPNLPERGPPASAPTTQGNSKPNANPTPKTESKVAGCKLNAASTLSRMLDDRKPSEKI